MDERKDEQLDARVLAYQANKTAEMLNHVRAGDSLVMDWRLTEAAHQYERASDIAQYHLYREDIVDWLGNRLKHMADNYLLTEGEKRTPDLDGLVL